MLAQGPTPVLAAAGLLGFLAAIGTASAAAVISGGTAPPPPPHELAGRTENCTSNSFHKLAWTTSNFTFHSEIVPTAALAPNITGWLGFDLVNEAQPTRGYKCYIDSATPHAPLDFFNGNQTYPCTLEDPTPWDAIGFTFNRLTGLLVVHQTWACLDLDPKWP